MRSNFPSMAWMGHHSCEQTCNMKPPQSWVSAVLWQWGVGVMYTADLNFLIRLFSLADDLRMRKLTYKPCFQSRRLVCACSVVPIEDNHCRLVKWSEVKLEPVPFQTPTASRQAHHVTTFKEQNTPGIVERGLCGPKQWFTVLARWAAHSTERRMRSTLCLNSQQLASYHLAQDSESSLGPPSEQGRASGVSFGMFQSERERRRLEVVVEFDLHSSDVGNVFTIRGHLHSAVFIFRA